MQENAQTQTKTEEKLITFDDLGLKKDKIV